MQAEQHTVQWRRLFPWPRISARTISYSAGLAVPAGQAAKQLPSMRVEPSAAAYRRFDPKQRGAHQRHVVRMLAGSRKDAIGGSP